jgi:GNAT superfamily N-acetyltransferase
MIVRKARVRDAEAVKGLQKQLAVDKREHAEEAKKHPGLFEETFKEALKNPLTEVYVAELDGKVVGTCILEKILALVHNGRPYALLEDMVVDEESRGRGVGKALVEKAISKAREWGCYKLMLVSRRFRKDTHKFYRSLGFKEVAKEFRIYL